MAKTTANIAKRYLRKEPMDTKPKALGQRLGYKRVSTIDQHTDRQLEGVHLDRCFEDKATGKNTDRPGLQAALEWARAGDTLVVWSMDRLGRSTRDMLRIVDSLTAKGVSIEFVKEGLTFRGDDSPMNRLILTVLSAVYECELGHISDRQKEGQAVAKRCVTCGKTRDEHGTQPHRFANKYTGRAPAIRAGNGKAELFARLQASGAKVSTMAKELGVSRQTIYSMLKAGKMEVAA